MKIEDISTELRPRTSWESVDLGFRMIQTWARPIIVTWLLFVLPVFLVINLILWQYPVWALFLVWWLKPLFDRIPLYIVSHAVFGDIPSVTKVRRFLPSLLKPHIFKTLFWYRLDPARGFNMPVWQLEGLRGTQRASRANVLQKGVHGTAITYTYFCLFIQCLLLFACYLLLSMFIPANVDGNHVALFYNDSGTVWSGLLLNFFHFITLSLIEPFYIAGSFALYLNRRTHLEAWDIELAFRQLAKRISTVPSNQSPGTRNTSLTSIVLVLCCLILTLPLFSSQVLAAPEITNSQAKKLIAEVMSQKEFDSQRSQQGWFLKEELFKEKKSKKNQELNWLAGIFSYFIGNMLSVLLWAVVIIALIYLIIRFRHYLPAFKLNDIKQHKKATTPDILFGLELDPDSLPDDVGQYAWLLWQQDKFIAALSLLYRGALSTLVNRDGLRLSNAATEGDCVQILKQSYIKQQHEHQDIISYFQSLTQVWQYAAYAHRFPNNEQAHKLCENWPHYFKDKHVQ